MNLNELTDILNTSGLEFSLNKPIKEEEGDAKIRRLKDILLFISGLLVVIGLIIFCIFLVITNIKTNSQISILAFNGAVALGSGFAGYVLRGKK